MLNSLALAWLLFPLGAALGWYFARKMPRPEEHASAANPDYLTGLSHLVNEDPDQAIAAFVRAIEVDQSTVELHLTLGNLFRRRGEVDRALRIHQNLLSRPNLKPIHLNQARFELAQDYHKAGVMDRAETLFKELVGQGMFLQPALEHLVMLYEQGRDWRQAIEAARQLEAARGQSLRPLIAQYYCERAEEARARKDTGEALRLLGRALSTYPECVRASLLQGALHEAEGNHSSAVKAYQRVPEQDARFVQEALPSLRRCYESLHDLVSYWKFLEEIEEQWPQPAVTLAKARLMQSEGLDAAAFLAQRLQQQPSWQGLNLLLELLAKASDAAAPILTGLQGALSKAIEASPRYSCSHCGFKPRLLFWQCPSCKQWNTVIPLDDALRPAG